MGSHTCLVEELRGTWENSCAALSYASRTVQASDIQPVFARQLYMNIVRKWCRLVNTLQELPPLQRSKVTGLRAENFSDRVCADLADATAQGAPVIARTVVDGATACA